MDPGEQLSIGGNTDYIEWEKRASLSRRGPRNPSQLGGVGLGLAIFGAVFFFSSRRRHTRFKCDWSSDVCSSDLLHCRAAPPTRSAAPHLFPVWGWHPFGQARS